MKEFENGKKKEIKEILDKNYTHVICIVPKRITS